MGGSSFDDQLRVIDRINDERQKQGIARGLDQDMITQALGRWLLHIDVYGIGGSLKQDQDTLLASLRSAKTPR